MTKLATRPAAPEPRSSADVCADLARLREENRQAKADVARLAAARPAVVRTGTDAELEAHDAEAARAGRTIERSAARIEVLTGELAAAERAEEQVKRRAAYEEARQLSAKVAACVRAEYGPAATVIRDLIQATQEAREVIEAVNARLPDGCDPVEDPEHFRGRPSLASVPYQEPSTVYVAPDGSRFSNAYPDPDAPGTYRSAPVDPRTPGAVPVQREHGVVFHHVRGILAKQEFVTRYRGGRSFDPAVPLNRTVALPGLMFGDPDVWRMFHHR